MKRAFAATAALALTILAAACAAPNTEPAAPQDPATTDEITAPSPSSTPSASTEPEPDGPPTYFVGETIELESADFIVEVLEERDLIETSFEEDYTARDGERLWFIRILWTNNLSEVVKKECHGPYSVDLHAYDIDGREMLMVDQPGYIEGQECSTGLMQGQQGTWMTAFRSLDAEFGWLLFDDYNEAEPVAVVLDPDLELTYSN